MGRVVIAAYKPKEGKAADLLQIVKAHYNILQKENLVTERKPVLMQAQDGTIIEVFEWLSPEAIELAHANPTVQDLWNQFAEACHFVPVSETEEAQSLFSEFTPI